MKSWTDCAIIQTQTIKGQRRRDEEGNKEE